jgi:hypothetical protein
MGGEREREREREREGEGPGRNRRPRAQPPKFSVIVLGAVFPVL